MGCIRQVGLFVLFFLIASKVSADETAERKLKILRKEVAATQSFKTAADPKADKVSDSGIESVSHVNLFGKKIEVVKNSVKYRVSEEEGLSHKNQFYVRGKKVLAESFEDGDGAYVYALDLPATEISGELFAYSLGIITVAVTSGISYEGYIEAQVESDFLRTTPVPIVSPFMNLVNASTNVDVNAQGFIEGQARILFFKGAVGGAVNLIDAQAQASISVAPVTITQPQVAYDGAVHLLSGQLYGYMASGNIKWLHYDFYKSQGKCFEFGDGQCQQQ